MRTIRDSKLETRAARHRLAPRGKAYLKTLIPSALALAYRRKKKDEPGLWLVRRYIGGERYRIAPLGLADDFQDADEQTVLSYAEAQRRAHEVYRRADHAPARGSLTVGDAIADYVAWLRAHRATADDAERRATKLILPTLGKIKLTDLTTTRIVHWRDRSAETPALLRTAPGEKQKFKPRIDKRARRATINRTLTILKAALNRAFAAGHIDDDTAWRRVKPFENVTAARPGYLSIAEAQRLLNAAEGAFRTLVHGALLTGARYGELTALRTRDYHRGKIHIAQSKSGRPRDITLTEEGVAFFSRLILGRGGDDFIFVHSDGRPWRKSEQGRLMRKACARARIEPAVGFHQLRHSWASHAVMNGMPLIVVAKNLGHASTVMVERHYGHLSDTYIDEAVRAHAPRFGAVAAGNVKPLRGGGR
jgi:integrase